MKKEINVWEYAGQILEQTGKGVLLTTKADGKVNTMTIGWGTLGIEWGKPICTVFVRQSRHTKSMLDASGEFTVNVPMGQIDKNILSVCGTKSGRDLDKIAQLGLTLECKVIYQQDQVLSAIDEESRNRYYAPGTPNGDDFHTAYYGLITAAYIIE